MRFQLIIAALFGLSLAVALPETYGNAGPRQGIY
jgi:hypothetical protein